MAKKRRKEEKEEEKYEFVLPDFDEKGFLEKDIKGTKALAVSIAVAIIAGLFAYMTTWISVFLGLALILVFIVALKWLYPLFKIEIESLEKKTIAGNYILVFLLALGIWIILLNPPFGDNQDPEIRESFIWFEHNGVWNRYVSVGATPIKDGDLINITVLARDNGRIESVQIEIHASGQSPSNFVEMESADVYGRFEYKDTFSTIGGVNTQYLYTVKVVDGVGRTATISGSFTVVP